MTSLFHWMCFHSFQSSNTSSRSGEPVRHFLETLLCSDTCGCKPGFVGESLVDFEYFCICFECCLLFRDWSCCILFPQSPNPAPALWLFMDLHFLSFNSEWFTTPHFLLPCLCLQVLVLCSPGSFVASFLQFFLAPFVSSVSHFKGPQSLFISSLELQI